MAAAVEERRLFVGGLGPSVTKDDVRAQLGRFGDVSSVELVSRVNERGSPEKTFAYVNVALSEAALRKCLGALDGSTWRGCSLRVQPARESFLHRLAQERLQAAQAQKQSPSPAPQARGPAPHVRAVPGSAVPGHKDWVVGKFGRVLPVLRLRSQNRRQVLKYDPSRYCHNLKRFEADATPRVSVSELTWALEGGDSDMSQRRQGRFPPGRPTKRARTPEAAPEAALEEEGEGAADAGGDTDDTDEILVGQRKARGNREASRPPGASSESEEDPEYAALMKGCPLLRLTLADLGELAGAGGDAPRAQRAPPMARRAKKGPGARCVDPKDILASLLEGEEKAGQQDGPKPKFRAFRGVGALYGGAGKDAGGAGGLPPCLGKPAGGDQRGAVRSPSSSSVSSLSSVASGESSSLCGKTRGTDLGSDGGLGSPKTGGPQQKRSDPVTHRASTGPEPKRELEMLNTRSERLLRLTVGRDGASCVRGKDPEAPPARGAAGPSSCSAPADAVSPHKNSEDNQKRLAALEERRRERELQKQLVQSALSSLDSRPASKPTHILFSSDSEDEAGEKEGDQKPLPGSTVKQDPASQTSGKLFESSEDEEQETDDDEARFQIKPQFEGKAGKKLMNLQSHFGADDRFRMDARFLESESEEEGGELKEADTAEEEELIAEKKKNMEVLKSILPISHQAPKPSKEETMVKRFRNVVHYDPTRLDHATFERKVDPEEKESKAKRRKKRVEAEKLPQVSKDLYYNIATDLKERFRATEPALGAGAAGPWNETPEETAEAPGVPDSSVGLGEFTFSFFGPDVGEVQEEPYKTEARPLGRMAWQQDPRFQDSSSEEDEEEPEPAAGSQEVAKPEEVRPSGKPSSRFFFFSENDERLCVGPGSFWQGSGSRLSNEDWESRTLVLLQDCRKKHKAARRKAKP